MKKQLLLFLILMLMAITAGCGGGSSSVGSDSSIVTITVGGNGQSASVKIERNTFFVQVRMFVRNLMKSSSAVAAIPQNVTDIFFTISAPGMTTFTRDVPVSGRSTITETFTVPNGKNRHFLVKAKDAAGTVQFCGWQDADLEGIPITLIIDMKSTLYVDVNTGSDTSNCKDVSTPCRTIPYAITQTAGNEEIFVAAGTYNTASGGTFPLVLKPGTFLNCAGANHSTIIDGSTAIGEDRTALRGAPGALIQGCTVIGDPAIDDNEDIITINDCVIDGSGICTVRGIALSASSSVKNSTVSNIRCEGSDGIRITGGKPAVKGNTLLNNDLGVFITGGTPTLTDNTISKNAAGISIFDSSPIITGNTITGNIYTGIIIVNNEITSRPSITNNKITQNGNGIIVGKVDTTPPNPLINHNTLSCNTRVDLLNYTAIMVNAQNNSWDHSPPKEFTSESVCKENPGADICNLVEGGSVDHTGSTMAAFPCP